MTPPNLADLIGLISIKFKRFLYRTTELIHLSVERMWKLPVCCQLREWGEWYFLQTPKQQEAAVTAYIRLYSRNVVRSNFPFEWLLIKAHNPFIPFLLHFLYNRLYASIRCQHSCRFIYMRIKEHRFSSSFVACFAK